MSDNNNSTCNPSQKIELESISKKFSVMNLLDPRSPTAALQRTPIQVILRTSGSVCTEECLDEISPKTTSLSSASFVSAFTPPITEDDSLELSTNSASFLSLENLTDIDGVHPTSNDLSIMSGDNLSVGEDTEREPSGIMSDKVYRSTEEVPNEQELILEGKTSVSHDNSNAANSRKEKQNTLDDSNQCESTTDDFHGNASFIRRKPLKNIFYTPNPNKKRNPLGPVENICPTTPPSHLSHGSPQNVLCEKQWKRIQEERKKLGLGADENTQLPLYDITASAPSKLMRKSRLHAHFKNVAS